MKNMTNNEAVEMNAELVWAGRHRRNDGAKNMKFRKKPVVIEAVQVRAADYNPGLPWEKAWDGSPFSEWPEWLVAALNGGRLIPHNTGGTDYAQWRIPTLEGVMNATPGDWVICGVRGELYPCKPDIFDATYEPAPDAMMEEGK